MYTLTETETAESEEEPCVMLLYVVVLYRAKCDML